MHWIKLLGHLCHPVFSPPISCTTGTQHWRGVPLLTHTAPSLSILVTLWGPLTAVFPPASAQTRRKSLQLLLAPFQVWCFYQARLEKANIKSGTWWPLPAAPPCLWTHPFVKAFLRSYQHWYTLVFVRVSLCMSACADMRATEKMNFFIVLIVFLLFLPWSQLNLHCLLLFRKLATFNFGLLGFALHQ